MIVLSPAMHQTLALIHQRCPSFEPEVSIILGSGLGSIRDQIRECCCIPYVDLPVFPNHNVPGHQADLVLGELYGRRVALFCGRFHVYQGLSCFDTTVTVRLAAALGCRSILLSCAVGGIAEEMKAGDFLLVRDHLNFSGINPLQGAEPPVFIDLHDCYRSDFFEKIAAEADRLNRVLHSGVLAYMPGPSYETPAEIRALRALGASAVSMSTIPESIMARALGMQVAALALVTNLAGGSSHEMLSHQEVLNCSASAAEPFRCLVKSLLAEFLVK
jgi:purine-nucleoside phosphorylase